MLKALAGAVLLAASTAVFAQSPVQPAQPGESAKPRQHARFDCSKAKDPQACEERRSKAREARKKARAACESASDKRACMKNRRSQETK